MMKSTVSSAIEPLECAICLGNILERDKTLKLNCKHIFHDKCVKPWLEKHDTCPKCRETATKTDAKNPNRARSHSTPQLAADFYSRATITPLPDTDDSDGQQERMQRLNAAARPHIQPT